MNLSLGSFRFRCSVGKERLRADPPEGRLRAEPDSRHRLPSEDLQRVLGHRVLRHRMGKGLSWYLSLFVFL